jgi:hypothetical protein
VVGNMNLENTLSSVANSAGEGANFKVPTRAFSNVDVPIQSAEARHHADVPIADLQGVAIKVSIALYVIVVSSPRNLVLLSHARDYIVLAQVQPYLAGAP